MHADGSANWSIDCPKGHPLRLRLWLGPTEPSSKFLILKPLRYLCYRRAGSCGRTQPTFSILYICAAVLATSVSSPSTGRLRIALPHFHHFFTLGVKKVNKLAFSDFLLDSARKSLHIKVDCKGASTLGHLVFTERWPIKAQK